MNSLLFFVLLIGIFIGMVQDLRRREVDNWLNFSLLLFGIVVFVFEALFVSDWSIVVQGLFVLFLGFVCMHLFYFMRVFAGGDAKLLFALSPFFIGTTFLQTAVQFFVFVLFLFFSGGMYGLVYSFVLFARTYKDSSKRIKDYLVKYQFWWFVLLGIVFIGVFFFVKVQLLLVLGILIIVFPFLFSFAKGLEEIVMIKAIDPKQVRLGDWLSQDVKVGKQVVKSTFDGVTKEELVILQKSKKKILIRDGIPFVPGFLIAFLLYYFFAGRLFDYVAFLL